MIFSLSPKYYDYQYLDLNDVKIGARSESDTEMATCEKHNTILVIIIKERAGMRSNELVAVCLAL